MLARTQDSAYDPTNPADPYAVIRSRALQQQAPISAATPSASTTATTPSPSFTGTPTAAPVATAPGPAAPRPFQTSGPALSLTNGNGPSYGVANPTTTPLQATSVPTSYASAPVDPAIASKVATYIQQNGLQANQSDPKALTNIVTFLRSQGVNAQVDATDSNGHTGGILVNGQPYQLIDGSNRWTPLQPWQESGGGGSSSANGQPLTAQPNPFLDQLKQLLMSRMTADGQPVNESDSYIAAPLNAARDEAQRQTQTERTALAERLYAQGDLNSNALTQGIQQSSERNATGLSTLRAQLITKELTARRDDLSQAMQLAVSAGDAESARAIQLQLAALNAQIQREGIGANLAISSANQNASTVNSGLNG